MAIVLQTVRGNSKHFAKIMHKGDLFNRVKMLRPYFKVQRRLLTEFRQLIHVLKKESLCENKVCVGFSRIEPYRCCSTDVKVHTKTPPVEPFALVEKDLHELTHLIKQELQAIDQELVDVSEYYFDGQGKMFRPMLVMLMAKSLNCHNRLQQGLLESQQKVAMIAEMLHTASLMHDDVIDAADTRRAKPSINKVWGQRKSILAGDFVLGMASITLASIKNDEVTKCISQITEDLVSGEFMQLGSKEKEEERFTHYINKSFRKTASLLANSCRAVAVLANCDDEILDVAYEYGKNIGISFQLIDDLLDFTSCDNVMGKPTAADLNLGLATAPVLFAAKRYPHLNALIMRRFSHEGDVEMARELVAKSNGVDETRKLAEKHSREAVDQIRTLNQSDFLKGLEVLAKLVLSRNK